LPVCGVGLDNKVKGGITEQPRFEQWETKSLIYYDCIKIFNITISFNICLMYLM